MLIVRQSTARTVTVGPVLDADGVAVTDGVVADFKLAKNGAAPAALNGSATLTHRNTGHYSLALTATDLDTVGTAEVVIDDTVNACPVKEITVVEEAVYDALFAASAPGYLQPTTAGRTLDVTATGAAGIDWGNVENQNTSVSLGATTVSAVSNATVVAGTVDTVTTVTGDVGGKVLGGGAGSITGVGVNANATQFAGTAYATALAAEVDAIWDEDATGHQTQGTFGQAIGDPGATAASIWGRVTTALPNAAPASNGGLPTANAANQVNTTPVFVRGFQNPTSGAEAVFFSGSIDPSYQGQTVIDPGAGISFSHADSFKGWVVSVEDGSSDIYFATRVVSSTVSPKRFTLADPVPSNGALDPIPFLLIPAGLTFPANFNATNIDASGRVLLQPTQTGVTIPTVTTVTNNPGLDAAGVRSAVGLAAANLDTQLGTISTRVATALPNAAAGADGGLIVLGENTVTNGVHITATNSYAVYLQGPDGGYGFLASGGVAGIRGGGNSGTNGIGISGLGVGTGPGIAGQGGITGGAGVIGTGGISNGHGIVGTGGGGTGHGMRLARGSSSADDLHLVNADTNLQLPSNGLANVTAWTVAITGDVTGNLSGTVGTVNALAAGAVTTASIADGAITDAKIALPAEASGRPTGALGMLRRIYEWCGGNKMTRNRTTGVVTLRNAADSGNLATATQSTVADTDTQTAGA